MKMDAFEFSNFIAGLKPGDEGYNDPAAAARGAVFLERAGYPCVGYNDSGELLYELPEDLIHKLKMRRSTRGHPCNHT